MTAPPAAGTAALVVTGHGDIAGREDSVIAGVARLVGVAGATVEAGLAVAVEERDLAVGAGEAGRAGAGVAALAGVEAGATVVAGLVVGAVVEILVAEEPAPALVAETFPGLLAAAVEAARVTDARVAEGTGPAALTPAQK